MKVWQIREKFGLENLHTEDLPTPRPKEGEILVKMTAASLNYRDLVTVSGGYGKTVQPPLIPCSDGVGEIVETGKKANRFKVGSRICPIFFPNWIDGPAQPGALPDALGGAYGGTLAQYMVLNEKACVQAPDNLDDLEAATLPCAALTAWSALCEHATLQAGDKLVIQGTGGVALFALQFAKALGAEVLMTSSSDKKLERAKEMGADHLVNYLSRPDWDKEVKAVWKEGADHVIELGGAQTLEKSVRSVRIGGRLSLIGVLSGAKTDQLALPLILMRNVCLQGITVGSRTAFERMNNFIQTHNIKPVIDTHYSMAEVPQAFQALQRGQHFGKICIEF